MGRGKPAVTDRRAGSGGSMHQRRCRSQHEPEMCTRRLPLVTSAHLQSRPRPLQHHRQRHVLALPPPGRAVGTRGRRRTRAARLQQRVDAHLRAEDVTPGRAPESDQDGVVWQAAAPAPPGERAGRPGDAGPGTLAVPASLTRLDGACALGLEAVFVQRPLCATLAAGPEARRHGDVSHVGQLGRAAHEKRLCLVAEAACTTASGRAAGLGFSRVRVRMNERCRPRCSAPLHPPMGFQHCT